MRLWALPGLRADSQWPHASRKVSQKVIRHWMRKWILRLLAKIHKNKPVTCHTGCVKRASAQRRGCSVPALVQPMQLRFCVVHWGRVNARLALCETGLKFAFVVCWFHVESLRERHAALCKLTRPGRQGVGAVGLMAGWGRESSGAGTWLWQWCWLKAVGLGRFSWQVTPNSHRMCQRITRSFYDIPHHAPAHVWHWNPSAIMVVHTHLVWTQPWTCVRPILVRCDLGVRDALLHAVWIGGDGGGVFEGVRVCGLCRCVHRSVRVQTRHPEKKG